MDSDEYRLTTSSLRALLDKAAQELADSERETLIHDLQTAIDYYDSLLAEQPDPGAAAVLSELIGPDLLSAKELMARLQGDPPDRGYVRANKSAIAKHGLAVGDIFTWLSFDTVEFSKGMILEISDTGILDLVLRKRGSARRYPMKLGARDFIAGRTPKTRRFTKR